MNPLLCWHTQIEKRWYGRPGWLLLLTPVEWLFYYLAKYRRRLQQNKCAALPVPVVVVGNIAVGGTGKTPTIIALVRYLQRRGRKPGVVSRGYGRSASGLCLLTKMTSVQISGDEPYLIYQNTGCDVAVSENRVEAIKVLCERRQCDVILADDGLQHYKMARDGEIVIVDGDRLFGNGHLLPVGPLREYPERLKEVDWVLINSAEALAKKNLPAKVRDLNIHQITVEPTGISQIPTWQTADLEKLSECNNLVAIAGLGNPKKFFSTLDSLGLHYQKKTFSDHHQYTAADFAGLENKTLVMTEKDAVKCRHLVGDKAYVLTIEMQIPEDFLQDFYLFLEAHTKKVSL